MAALTKVTTDHAPFYFVNLGVDVLHIDIGPTTEGDYYASLRFAGWSVSASGHSMLEAAERVYAAAARLVERRWMAGAMASLTLKQVATQEIR